MKLVREIKKIERALKAARAIAGSFPRSGKINAVMIEVPGGEIVHCGSAHAIELRTALKELKLL